jgi:hypothetical protein
MTDNENKSWEDRKKLQIPTYEPQAKDPKTVMLYINILLNWMR